MPDNNTKLSPRPNVRQIARKAIWLGEQFEVLIKNKDGGRKKTAVVVIDHSYFSMQRLVHEYLKHFLKSSHFRF